MGQEEFFTVHFDLNGAEMDRDIELFGEVVAHPEVMIAYKGFYGDTGIGQLCQLAQQAGVAFGDYVAVFEPHVENIA